MNESDKQKADLEWLYSDRPREQRHDDPTQVFGQVGAPGEQRPSGPRTPDDAHGVNPADEAIYRDDRSSGQPPSGRQGPRPDHTRVMPSLDRRSGGRGKGRPGGAAQQGSPRPSAQQGGQRRPTQPPAHQTAPAARGAGNVPPRHPQAPAMQSAPPPPPRVRRRRRGGFGRTLLVLLLLLVVWLVGVPLYHLSRAGSIDATPHGDRPADQPGTAILLAGNDARPGVAGARTDSMMILFLPTTGKPALISLPRDSYVPIPGHGRNKLNAAYALGGPPLLVQTVEQNTGLRIDGYLEVSMSAFPEAVDAVGGIELCLDKPMKDKDSKADFPAGCQHMDGAGALAYSRMRKADPRGDLGRIDRQREVIAAVTKKAMSPATLLPWRYWNLSEAGSNLLKKGSETSVGELGQAALGFREVSAGKGISMTVPISNPAAQTSAGSSVLWDKDLTSKMFADLARGDTSKLTTYQR